MVVHLCVHLCVYTCVYTCVFAAVSVMNTTDVAHRRRRRLTPNIQDGAKTGPAYLIANIKKTPWPNCVEIGEFLQCEYAEHSH